MGTKLTLEEAFDELLFIHNTLGTVPTAVECTEVLYKYAPKKTDWPAVLRKIADYIESRPKPVMIHPHAVKDIIALVMEKT